MVAEVDVEVKVEVELEVEAEVEVRKRTHHEAMEVTQMLEVKVDVSRKGRR